MALTALLDCGPCNRLPAILAELGLGHWQRQYDAGLHYLTTAVAVVARHVASEDRVADLRRQLEDIQIAGRVAWVDVSRLGDFVVYQAPHGSIPVDVPGSSK
jgi:hypothetical protein